MSLITSSYIQNGSFIGNTQTYQRTAPANDTIYTGNVPFSHSVNTNNATYGSGSTQVLISGRYKIMLSFRFLNNGVDNSAGTHWRDLRLKVGVNDIAYFYQYFNGNVLTSSGNNFTQLLNFSTLGAPYASGAIPVFSSLGYGNIDCMFYFSTEYNFNAGDILTIPVTIKHGTIISDGLILGNVFFELTPLV